MKIGIAVSILVASILALTSMSSFAGQGSGPGGADTDRGQQVDRDRNYDRDRMSDRDRTQDRARSEDPQQDRVRLQDPAKIKDGDIYGNEMMSVQERNQYREQLRVMGSDKEQQQFQAQHEEKMRVRALEQGKELVPPGQGQIYGGEFMSVQERNQYREQLRVMGSDKEREQFQAQHRERIDQRAKNLEVEEAE